MSEYEGVDAPFEDDRPEWLPEKFQTPEALASAYVAAQRKITEQGQQLAAQHESLNVLSQQFETLATGGYAEPAESDFEAPSAVDTMYSLAEEARERPRLSPEAIQEIVARSMQSQAQGVDMLAAQAGQIAASQVPNWQEVGVDVMNLIGSNPSWASAVNEAGQTGSPAAIAGVLSSAASSLQAGRAYEAGARAQENRAMKLAAQMSHPGGGNPGVAGSLGSPRPLPEDDDWNRVKAAGTNSYADLITRPRG